MKNFSLYILNLTKFVFLTPKIDPWESDSSLMTNNFNLLTNIRKQYPHLKVSVSKLKLSCFVAIDSIDNK